MPPVKSDWPARVQVPGPFLMTEVVPPLLWSRAASELVLEPVKTTVRAPEPLEAMSPLFVRSKGPFPALTMVVVPVPRVKRRLLEEPVPLYSRVTAFRTRFAALELAAPMLLGEPASASWLTASVPLLTVVAPV